MFALSNIEKIINSELASKIQYSLIKNNELTIEIYDNDLIEVIQFLKSNEKGFPGDVLIVPSCSTPSLPKGFIRFSKASS